MSGPVYNMWITIKTLNGSYMEHSQVPFCLRFVPFMFRSVKRFFATGWAVYVIRVLSACFRVQNGAVKMPLDFSARQG